MLHSVKGHQGFESCASHQAPGHGHRLTFFSWLHWAQVRCRESGEMVSVRHYGQTMQGWSHRDFFSRHHILHVSSARAAGSFHSGRRSDSFFQQQTYTVPAAFFWPSWKSFGSRVLIHVTVVAQKSQCARYFRGAKKEAIPIPNSFQSNQTGQGKIRRK